MTGDTRRTEDKQTPGLILDGPPKNPAFEKALDEFVATARQGHQAHSPFFNPPHEWVVSHMRIFQDLPPEERQQLLQESRQIAHAAEQANAQGRAAGRAGPDAVFRPHRRYEPGRASRSRRGSGGGAPAAGGLVRVVGPEALPAGGILLVERLWLIGVYAELGGEGISGGCRSNEQSPVQSFL